MSKFCCDICGCEPESLWFFSGYGGYPKDDKEYCESCFNYKKEHLECNSPKAEEKQKVEVQKIDLIA